MGTTCVSHDPAGLGVKLPLPLCALQLAGGETGDHKSRRRLDCGEQVFSGDRC